jgi:DNA (cytosine-5)-methyltransferase 3A
MNVLSLFDGMSCGQIALDKLGIKPTNYFASEIDKFAIQTAKKNFPDTIHLGDVTKIQTSGDHLLDEFECGHKIDLLIGGSPCQGFSYSGKRLNFEDPRSKLFFEYVRLLKELKPKYFLLENVRMAKASQDIISEYLGVEPVVINSNLVSAQNRHRLYWTNIPNVTQPKDKAIVLKDILEDYDTIGEEHFHSNKAMEYMERGNKKWMQAGSRRADRYTQSPDKEKAFTLTANFHKGVPYNYFDDTRATSNETTGLILEGHATNLKGHDYVKRIYSPDGKAPSLCASSGGNLEPKVSVKGARIVNRRLDENGTRKDNDTSIPLQAQIEVRADDISNCLTTVQKDSIVVKDKRWRKLTPLECERLQTVPDGYTDGVSNTQRYRQLGNGWTVDVIAHILKGI